MPEWMRPAIVVLAVVALVPFALIASARSGTTTRPRLHVFFDMDNQPKLKAQAANPLFADGRAMRPPVAGAVARDELAADPKLNRGLSADTWTGPTPPWVETISLPITEEMVRRGRERFDIYCAPCHGLSGFGDGIVAKRAEKLAEGTWVPPLSLHDQTVRARPSGHLFNTITNGIRTMPAYGPQIPVADRWAVVAYVRALQRSQNASLDDVPPDVASQLQKE
jgi:mono/diheme cytochrome c family protein